MTHVVATPISLLLLGFTLASVRPPPADGGLVIAAFESRVLFTLLLFSFSLLIEFALVSSLRFVLLLAGVSLGTLPRYVGMVLVR